MQLITTTSYVLKVKSPLAFLDVITRLPKSKKQHAAAPPHLFVVSPIFSLGIVNI